MTHGTPLPSSALETPRAPAGGDDPTLTQDVLELDRSAELSRSHEQPPAVVPGYTILRRLGEGAFGSVWLARELNTGKQVSIKFYTHRRGLDWSLLNREVEKLAVLYTSRNIISLIDVGWDSDPPYYIMEYLPNGSLAEFLGNGSLPVPEAVRIAKSVATALVHAHGSGILHCDLKPANVLLDADYEPRLCDFGQSRLSDEQYPALGTLFYMAPEQADLKAVPDARWDVYALGALLYHMLCGTAPYRTPDAEAQIRAAETLEDRLAVYRRLLKQSPRPHRHRKQKGIDRRLVEIVDRCLAIDPQRRYPNAQAVLDALEVRDRLRARRPLVVLGAVGPALLLFAMAFVFVRAMENAVHHARANLVDRALESDAHSAQLLANNLQRELEGRRAGLERMAEDPDLRAAILEAEATDWEDRTRLNELLNNLRQSVDRQRVSLNRRPDTSWFLTDAVGFQRWRDPHDEKTYDGNFSYRDYFHGGNEELPDLGRTDLSPIRKPHISTAFRSEATRQYMVAISVPVWNEDQTRVIGVLARTTHLGELLSDHADKIRGGADDVDRTFALIDHRDFKLLDHPWMTPANLASLPRQSLEDLRLDERMAASLADLAITSDDAGNPSAGHTTGREAAYRDPVGAVDPDRYGGVWLAAFCSVGNTGWTAVVQEKREEALRPIEEMQQGLWRYGLVALLGACTLIGVLWYFVYRAMNERVLRVSMARNGALRTANGTTAVTDRSNPSDR